MCARFHPEATRHLLIAGCVLVLAAGVHAAEVNGAEIIEFGTFRRLAVDGNAAAPKAGTGQINAVREAVLDESGTEILASVGTSFGIRVKITGDRDKVPVTCTFRWTHPKMKDPETGRTSESDEWEASTPVGVAQYTGYTIDEDWELVPGKWTLQVIYKGRVLAEKSFSVSLAAQQVCLMRPAVTEARSSFALR